MVKLKKFLAPPKFLVFVSFFNRDLNCEFVISWIAYAYVFGGFGGKGW